MNYKENILNDKTIGYFDTTEFLIQIGRGKSAYRTRYKVVGNLAQAVHPFQWVERRLRLQKASFRPILHKANPREGYVMTHHERQIRQNIRAFLLTATLDELYAELQLSLDMNDAFRADCICELIIESEQEG